MLDLLIIIIIIIIIIFRVGIEYRIYSIDRERRGGGKGGKSCPKYDKVRIGGDFCKKFIKSGAGFVTFVTCLILMTMKTLVENENQKE